MSMRDRVTALEQRHMPSEPEVIIIKGGLCAFDDTSAEVGNETMRRDPAEPFPAFQARLLAMAKAVGEPFAFIGGLPE